MKRAIITGGAGFIGSHLVRQILQTERYNVLNIDALTYAGNLATTADFDTHANYSFSDVDIRDADRLNEVVAEFEPDLILHLAAESHVDRSIDGPLDFITTNVVGTYNLLQASRRHFANLEEEQKAQFRFVNVSTDEVFGSLGPTGSFNEDTGYDPRSPYSASKASADHIVRAWYHTFGVPTIITNCSNNYGPYQYPEKLIPVVINKILGGEQIPVYGDGSNIRDWLHVSDHASAILCAAENGTPGETYLIGASCEKTNLEMVRQICAIMDAEPSLPDTTNSASLITFVEDRPGHDTRYAVDASKIRSELGWSPAVEFTDGLASTVRWYLNNRQWCQTVLGGSNTIDRRGKAK